MELHLRWNLEHCVHALHDLRMQSRQHGPDSERARREQKILHRGKYGMRRLLANRQCEDDHRSIDNLVGEP